MGSSQPDHTAAYKAEHEAAGPKSPASLVLALAVFIEHAHHHYVTTPKAVSDLFLFCTSLKGGVLINI